MKRQNLHFIISIAVVFVLGAAVWILYSPPPPAPRVSSLAPSPTAQAIGAAIAHSSAPVFMDDGSPISLKTMTRDVATWIYAHRSQRDVYYDWEQPLNFYGKVIDQDNNPVSGASVHMVWTTLGVPGGTLERQTESDQGGLFSLTDQRGKGLGVRVEKQGYYSVDRGGAEVSFEYANPSSPNWYEPDSSSPAIFHLRKKGEGVKLVNKSVNLSLPGIASGAVDLLSGYITASGSLQVQSNKPDSQSLRRLYPWSVTLSMPTGGLVETDDQFPFTAPASGYSPTAVMDMTNPNVPTWRNGDMKTYYFYLPASNTYGLMHVNTLGATSHVYLNYSYNPTPGDRNLKPASNQ